MSTSSVLTASWVVVDLLAIEMGCLHCGDRLPIPHLVRNRCDLLAGFIRSYLAVHRHCEGNRHKLAGAVMIEGQWLAEPIPMRKEPPSPN